MAIVDLPRAEILTTKVPTEAAAAPLADGGGKEKRRAEIKSWAAKTPAAVTSVLAC
jgi:hypothetical protein